ncbi:replication protein RepA [Sphingomonas yabuuchiae]|uniref:Replication protein n=1 Tax=Sphingomonas yabuuchiae TaxID=172044 RepID=A0AA40ZW81_9SPHN|nr:replication protein RepA [Sphingomonas yabuuchiae]MBB4611436.1 hypothetical protein [Sphingomonas yabuuchiae]MBN3556817.1 replication protein [Sphingomonas yabuuchiae]
MAEGLTSIGSVAGDLFASIEKQRSKKTARELTLIDKGLEIAQVRPEGDDVTFMHSILCQIGLPRSKFDGDRFERKNGSAALEVRAGSIWTGTDMVQQPIPYGPIPRLILAYVSTFAVRERTPEIPFGESANDALRILGIDKGGPAYKMFRTQVSALAACSMTIGFTAGDRAYTFHGNPVEQFEAWLPGQEGQRSLWPSSMVLGRRFYETLLDHAVPVDLRAFSSLRGSAMAMDLYLYLVQRLHRISRPVGLTWWMLKDQFGQEYVGEDALADFKKKFKKALAQAQSVYPDAKIEIVRGGIKLFSSRPAVDPKEAKRLRV